MSLYLVLAGTTGVGKSTLTKKLSDRFHYQSFYEHLDDNPYLADFYAGKGSAVSFEMQMYFLGQRVAQQTEIERIIKTGTDVIHDRSIYEDFHIFATHQYNQGFMTDLQFATYRRLFFAVMERLYPPDLIIYLHATTDRLLEQINLRGRDYETKIDTSYLSEINELYEQWLQRLEEGPTTIPFLPIDVCQVDLLEKDFDAFCEELQQRIKRIRGH